MRADAKGRPYSAQYTPTASRRVDDPSFRRRCLWLFGEEDLNRRLQKAFQRGHSSIDAWMMGRNIPIEVMFVIELLEQSAPTQWPERWREIVTDGHVAWMLLNKGASVAEVASIMGVTPYKVRKMLGQEE